MAIYVSDNFHDTNGVTLNNHTPQTGGAWAASGSAFTIESNALTINDFTSTTLCANATTASTANYQVEITLLFSASGVGDGDFLGVGGRGNFSAANYYIAYYNGSYSGTAQQVRLSSVASGVETSLGTYSLTYVQGASHTLTLVMNGSTISCMVDSVTQISVTNTTYTTGTGIAIYGGEVASDALNATGFLAQDISSGGSTAAPNHMLASMGVGT